MNENVKKLLQTTKPPVLSVSLGYLCRDLILMSLYGLFVYIYTPYLPHNIWWIFYMVYSLVMGTLAIGPWVLAHECGHGAFAPRIWQNDAIGFVLHSFLMVPYFPWKYSHATHHKNTNNIIYGETHVPDVVGELVYKIHMYIHETIGPNLFAIFFIVEHLVLGWPAYLLFNATGSKQGPSILRNHFIPNDLFPPLSEYRVYLSTVAVGLVVYTLIKLDIMKWYIGPYLVMNSWLVTYTWLHHTSSSVPHFGPEDHSFIRGALCTIDRPYPWLIDFLHHDIGSSHVIHHLNPRIPFHEAKRITPALKKILGSHYNYDSNFPLVSLWDVAKNCHAVRSTDGTIYLESFSSLSKKEK